MEESTKDGTDKLQRVTRDELYRMVWAEPMTTVARKFGVSSSYMARVCRLLDVPRPERGYWAKRSYGKSVRTSPLPPARVGQPSQWERGMMPEPDRALLPRPPVDRPRRLRKAVPADTVHALITGAREHFAGSRTVYDSKYLKPWKRLLIDMVLTESTLDKALAFANAMFCEFEAHGCAVAIAPHGAGFHRAQVDEHEVPEHKKADPYAWPRHWSPARITVVSIGDLPIGLTVIELSEQAECRYVNGDYVRLDALPPRRRGRLNDYRDWTTNKDFPTGRLCLQAYCADGRAEWVKQWRETPTSGLTDKIPAIVRSLLEAAPEVAALIAEGQRQAVIRQQEWEAEKRERERERAAELRKQAMNESQQTLLKVIEDWRRTMGRQAFFEDSERRIATLPEAERASLLTRLREARVLAGEIDPLSALRRWQTPAERLQELETAAKRWY